MKTLTWIFLVVAAASLSGLFVLLKPTIASPQPPMRSPAESSSTVEPVAPGPRTFALIVENGKLVSGPGLIEVGQGDEVRLVLTSDRDDQLHLHGYDLHLSLRAHEAATLDFTANRSGRFDYELHRANLELGALEVQPQ